MRTYWSAIFSSAKRVKRALFAFCRKVLRSHTKAGFSSKSPAPLEKLLTIIQRETTKALTGQTPLENLLTAIQHEATKALTGQALSDVLAAFQGMCDRRRLGIKNEAEGYGLIPLTQDKFTIVDAEDYDTCPEQKKACLERSRRVEGSDFGFHTTKYELQAMNYWQPATVYILLSNWALAPNPSPLNLRTSTSVENALQINPFMQNKANLLDAQMKVTS